MQVKKVRNSYLAKSDPRRISDFSLKSRSRKHLLGSLGQILEKSKRRCPFCSLVIKSVTEPGLDAWEDYDAVSAATCSIIWEVDGREAASGSGRARARTRRIHLCWNEPRLKDSYLIFVAPEKYSRPNSDAQWVCGNEALFLGRDIDPAECNQALIKSWLDLCCSSHRGPCTDMGESSEKFDEMVKQSYFGVIDVLNMQLTSLPYDLQQDQRFEEPKMVPYVGDRVPWVHSGRPYQPQQVKRAPFVALSYVWKRGKAPYTTKLSNIMLYRRPGGLGKIIMKLPRVIQDAIELVRRLGMRYIWIDSLCIVQDSPRSWNLNARNMDLIYGNAILTICAADGSDSSTGLRAMYPKPEDYCQHKEECVPGVTLMASRHPEMGIEASTWNTRAWTFQERLLSKRCLIFTEGRVYFQCRSTGMSEDIFADRQGAGWSLDLINAPLRMLLELSSRAVKVYMNCVSLYTSRILSNPQDILAAFIGISNFMEQTLQAPFVFGLPTSHFDLALLWESQGALGRRIPVVFPSWSWCGWIGPNGATVEYKAKMVEGCFTNLHEWLTRHTWICWYVRDGRGNLRPLWDAKKSRADKTTHERWRGYKSRPQKQRKPDSDKLWYKSQKVVNRNRRGSAGTSDSQDSHRTRRTRRREGYDNGDKDKSYDRVVHEVESELQSDAQSNSDNDIEVYGDYDRIFPSDDDIEVYGDYGRILPSDVSRQNQKNFHLTLPENPYRVVMADFNSEPDKEFPDQPLLQFWTWQTTLHILPFESEVSEMKPGTGLRRYDIADDIGDWCGSIVLDEQQIKDAESSQHEFIAISDAKSFSAEECEIWTYYIPQEREQSEWDLYYVLLIKLVDRKWERVGLGKVFKLAFSNSEWKEIILG